MASDVDGGTHVWREAALSATIHRACVKCGAPGKFLDNEHIKKQFPACWVPRDHSQFDVPVGDRCPHCGTSRSPGLIKQLGEIWRKRFTC